MTASISLRSLLGRPREPDFAGQTVPGHGVLSQAPTRQHRFEWTRHRPCVSPNQPWWPAS